MAGHVPARLARVGTGFAIGLASAVLTFTPWLVAGARLPLQNLWRENVLPEDMPLALLPISQYHAIQVAVLLIVGGTVAGSTVRLLRPRIGARSWSASVGVLFVQGIAIIQSFVVVADGLGISEPRADARAILYFGGMLVGTIVAALLAQAAFWLVSRRSVALASLGLALSAVPFTSWIMDAVTLLAEPGSLPTVFLWVSRWLPAIIVGVVLGWCGIRPRRRVTVWVVSLAALWITPALFTSVWNALGMRVLNGDLGEMRDVATQIFPLALGISALPVFVALVLGGLITGVRTAIGRTRTTQGQQVTATSSTQTDPSG